MTTTSLPPVPSPHRRWAFDGRIAGIGSTSGVRVVIGSWDSSPLGAFADAMVERADGHRLLIAPNDAVGDLVMSTYSFDEVRVEPLECVMTPTWLTFASTSLQLSLGLGPRTALGWALRMVPGAVASSPAWTWVSDPVARVAQRGVRTRGRTASGREWYGARDHHVVRRLAGALDGIPLGALAPVRPETRFGFSSSPARPSLTHLTSTVEVR